LEALIVLCQKEKIRYHYLGPKPEIKADEKLPVLAKQDMRLFNYLSLGDSYVGSEAYEEAYAEYNKAILHMGTLQPYHAYAFCKRGFVCKKLNQMEDAVLDYTRALELKPDYIDAYMARGFTYYEMERYPEALADFAKLKEIRPSLPTVYMFSGLTYRLLGDFENALVDLNKATELQPSYLEAFFHRGLTYFELKDYEKSIEDFTKVIEIAPQYVNAFLKRALVYMALKKSDLAIQDLNAAIRLDPNDIDAYYYRGQALFEKGYHEYQEQAIRDWEKAIELGSPFAELLEQKIKLTSRLI
jgi:tetratricopeptide (TPR) repeat protein